MSAAPALLSAAAREAEAVHAIFPSRRMRERASEAALSRWPEPFFRAQLWEGMAQNPVIRNGNPEALGALLHLLEGAARDAV